MRTDVSLHTQYNCMCGGQSECMGMANHNPQPVQIISVKFSRRPIHKILSVANLAL